MSLIDLLRAGIDTVDLAGEPVTYRLLRDSDGLIALTNLLHAAYAPLAAAEMRFVASHQSVETTRYRVGVGDTVVAVVNSAVIGTITLASVDRTNGSPFYDRPDVMSVGQFAVKPSRQGRGIGSRLLDVAEQLARDRGATFVGLDTSEHATHLIAFYEARGYRFVEHVRWSEVNYRSVVMAKTLALSCGGSRRDSCSASREGI